VKNPFGLLFIFMNSHGMTGPHNYVIFEKLSVQNIACECFKSNAMLRQISLCHKEQLHQLWSLADTISHNLGATISQSFYMIW
jgi:hypothetical protein